MDNISHQICRTCLQEISTSFVDINSTEANSNVTIRQQLSNCIPELDLNIAIIPNPVICSDCADALKIIDKFKQKCLVSEMQIFKYIQDMEHIGDVNLQNVLQFHLLECFNFNIKYEAGDFDESPVNPSDAIMDETDTFTEAIEQECVSLLDTIDPERILNIDAHSTDVDKPEENESSIIIQGNLPQVNTLNTSYSCCTQCNYQSRSKQNLSIHMRTHTKKKPYKCLHCDYECSQKGRLKQHTRTHTKEKPYRCTFCEYRCSLKHSLNVHVRTHTGEKPFKCSYCDYECSQKNRLTEHIRTHTKEKPYECSECDFQSSLRNTLNVHMRSMHGVEKSSNFMKHLVIHTAEKRFKCLQCKYKCAQEKYIKLHTMRAHNK